MKAEELKQIRADLKMTRRRLAEYLEITETTIYNYEREVYKIPKAVEIAINSLIIHKK
jgi:DNA-binding XRE family transcriptional regulator